MSFKGKLNIPRHYVRKTTKGRNISTLKKAAEYTNAENSLRSYAKRFSIDRMTLKRFIAASHGNIVIQFLAKRTLPKSSQYLVLTPKISLHNTSEPCLINFKV